MLENKVYYSKHGDIVVTEKNGKQIATVNGRQRAITVKPYGYEVKLNGHYVVLKYTNGC